MRDPFAPRMDLSYPSLRGQTKIHKWSKWITNGRTFHCSGEQISRRKQLYKLRMGLCSTFRNYEVHQNRIFPEIPAKIREKPVKNRSKTGQKPGTLSRDQPEQLLLLDFFDYLKKTFLADSGRTGSPRANLRPFLKSPPNVAPFY